MSAQNHAADATGDDARRHQLITLMDGTTGEDHQIPADPDGVGVPGAGPSKPGGHRARLGRVCAVSVSQAGVSGAGVTVMGSIEAGLAGRRDQLWATGPLARRLEDVQLTAGEGPCLDAYHTGAPVLAGDLAAEQTRWLGFAAEAIAAGAAAAFSLPLQVGAVRLGTLDLHRTAAGPLSRPQLVDALMLATLATEVLLELAGDPDPDRPSNPDGSDDPGPAGLLSESSGWLPDVHAEVHQASGMVAVRENIGVGEALLRLRGHAFAHGEAINRIARMIIARELVLPDKNTATDCDHDDPENGSADSDGGDR